jgi:DNA-binding NarL/FixJ family response regulator
MSRSPLKIILADDHVLFREMIRECIRRVPGLEVVGEVGDGLELLDLLKESVPDLVILDIAMPKLDGIKAAKEIKRLYPEVKILMLTAHKSSGHVYSSISAGADGYLLKENAYDDLLSAIDTIQKGSKYISNLISDQVADIIRWQPDEGESKHKNHLSSRELEVLRFIAQGKKSKEIADLLSLSVLTVYNHRNNIRKKLKVQSTAELVKYAILQGYV